MLSADNFAAFAAQVVQMFDDQAIERRGFGVVPCSRNPHRVHIDTMRVNVDGAVYDVLVVKFVDGAVSWGITYCPDPGQMTTQFEFQPDRLIVWTTLLNEYSPNGVYVSKQEIVRLT